MFRSLAPEAGNSDELYGGEGFDILVGGSLDDLIEGGPDHDIILGDHAHYDFTFPANQPIRSIATHNHQYGGNDRLFGNSGDDFILGQQGDDEIHGGSGQDDLTGGHNSLSDSASGHDGDDTFYGGDQADVIIGDNGIIERTIVGLHNWERYPSPHSNVELDDIQRQVIRFDDTEHMRFDDWQQMHGDDTVFAGDGNDIVHGQRGNDIIHGERGSDELIGHLGDDHIWGGADDDYILADAGAFVRDYLDENTPRLNSAATTWHRNIVLEDFAYVNQSFSLNETEPSESATTLLAADWIMLAGVYDISENPVLSDVSLNIPAYKGLILEAFPTNDDFIDGGTGNDILLGQRGADRLSGSEGNDMIFGDNAVFHSAYSTDYPNIYHGVRLFQGSANDVVIDDQGNFVSAPVQIRPEVLNYNRAFNQPANLAQLGSVKELQTSEIMGSEMVRLNATESTIPQLLMPQAFVTPQILGHESVLDGNDHLSGGTGNDIIYGDHATLTTPLNAGVPIMQGLIDDTQRAIDITGHSLSQLAKDNYQASGQLMTHVSNFGNDVIFAGAESGTPPYPDNNIVFGDEAFIIANIQEGIPADTNSARLALERHANNLQDLRITFDLFEAKLHRIHHQTLVRLIEQQPGESRLAINRPTFEFGNDTITGSAANDNITGDESTLVVKTVNQSSRLDAGSLSPTETDQLQTDLSTFIEQLDSQHEHIAKSAILTAEIPAEQLNLLASDISFPLHIGNDVITGDAGNDSIVGDFRVVAEPVITTALLSYYNSFEQIAPTCNLSDVTPLEFLACLPASTKGRLANDIKVALTGIKSMLEERRHFFDFEQIEAKYEHTVLGDRNRRFSNTLLTGGSDNIDSGSGNDIVLADSESYYTLHVNPDDSMQLFVNDTEYFNRLPDKLEIEHLDRSNFEIYGNYANEGVQPPSQNTDPQGMSNDYVYAGDGEDIVFGQFQNDQLVGGADSDVIFGGAGFNILPEFEFGDDNEDLRLGSDNRLKRENLSALKILSSDNSKYWDDTFANDIEENNIHDSTLTLTVDASSKGLLVGSLDSITDAKYKAYHNPAESLDVNNDEHISAIDALVIINLLNKEANQELRIQGGLQGRTQPYWFIDTNNDGHLSPLDALNIVNHLNSAAEEPEGEQRYNGTFNYHQSTFGFENERLLNDTFGESAEILVSAEQSIIQSKLSINSLDNLPYYGTSGDPQNTASLERYTEHDLDTDTIDDDLLSELAADIHRLWN